MNTEPKLSECCGAKVEVPEMRYSGNYGCSCGKTYRIEAQAAFLRCQKSHPKYAGTCVKCGKPCTIASKPETITDGFGSEAPAICPTCHRKAMYVCRPGSIRCHVCYDHNNPEDYELVQHTASPDQPDSDRLLSPEETCKKAACAYANDKIPHQSCPYQRREACAIYQSSALAIKAQRDLTASLKDGEITSLKHLIEYKDILLKNDGVQFAKLQADHKAEVLELRDALDGILGYAEEYHTAFDGETGKTRDWYLQAISHAQEVSKKCQALKASVEGK